MTIFENQAQQQEEHEAAERAIYQGWAAANPEPARIVRKYVFAARLDRKNEPKVHIDEFLRRYPSYSDRREEIKLAVRVVRRSRRRIERERQIEREREMMKREMRERLRRQTEGEPTLVGIKLCSLPLVELQCRLDLRAGLNPWAQVFLVALRIESNNLRAKEYNGSDFYFPKQRLMSDLIEIYRSQDWVFGVHPSDKRPTTHIIYFDLPTGKHISWHYSPQENLPTYPGEWDGLRHSTFAKVGEAILAMFPEIISKEERAEEEKRLAAEKRAEEKRLARNARARERYAAKAAARSAERAKWRARFFDAKELKARGWNQSLIKGLGEPDDYERRGRAYARLWCVERAQAVERDLQLILGGSTK